MSVRLYVNATADRDLRNHPFLQPELEFGNINYCTEVLNVVDSGWLRVYKVDGVFDENDTLLVSNLERGVDVAGGEDLATSVTADGSRNYIDIYDDSSSTVDAPGHKNAPLLVEEQGTENTAAYRVTLNGSALGVRVGRCTRGSLAVLYP